MTTFRSYNGHLMLLLALLCSLCLCSGRRDLSAKSTLSPRKSESSGWKKIWSDEFDFFDHSKWEYQLEDGCKLGVCNWGNREKSWYTDSNIVFRDGTMQIQAREETGENLAAVQQKCWDRCGQVCAHEWGVSDDHLDGCVKDCGNHRCPQARFTSSRIRTYGKFSISPHQGGYKGVKIEARIKLKCGKGMWPAFWMLPETGSRPDCSGCGQYGVWPASGEIDIMEMFGGKESLNKIHGTLHYGGVGAWSHKTMTAELKPTKDDFHVYAIEWNRDRITWLLDGEKYGSVVRATDNSPGWWTTGSAHGPFDVNFHILLNLAVGGEYTGNTPPDVISKTIAWEQQYMEVDYVRVYGRNNIAHDNTTRHRDKFYKSCRDILYCMRLQRINPTFAVIVTVLLVVMDLGLADTVQYDEWEIIWQDTFSNGVNIDETWNIETGDSWQYGFPMWGNSERQFYTKDSVRVTQDGVLKITASYVDDGSLQHECWDECYQRCVGAGKIPDTVDFFYCMGGCGNTGNRCSNVGKVGIKSGRLNTKGPVPGPSDEYPVVRIEARIRMSESGLGLWPAFWMLPWVPGSKAPGEGEYGSWPLSGEIDIMESANQFDFVNGSIHYGGSVEDGKNEHYSVSTSLNQSMAEEYHTFGFQWHRGLMRWYVNDTFYGKVSKSKWWTMADLENKYAPFDKRFYLILNLAVGGIYPEYNAGRQISVEELQNTLKEPKSMYIDRVTVWGLPKK